MINDYNKLQTMLKNTFLKQCKHRGERSGAIWISVIFRKHLHETCLHIFKTNICISI